MNTGHNNAAAIAVDIAKGWRPNYYLTNMAMSYFQAPGMNVAPSIFQFFQYMQALEATSRSFWNKGTRDRERKQVSEQMNLHLDMVFANKFSMLTHGQMLRQEQQLQHLNSLCILMMQTRTS